MVGTRAARRALGHNRVLKLLRTRVPLVRFEAVRECPCVRGRSYAAWPVPKQAPSCVLVLTTLPAQLGVCWRGTCGRIWP